MYPNRETLVPDGRYKLITESFSKSICNPGTYLGSRGMDNRKILSELGYNKREIEKFYKGVFDLRFPFYFEKILSLENPN